MNRAVASSLMLAILIGFSVVDRVKAQSASTQVPVTATVIRNCTIRATPVAFGNYDPIVAHATQPLDSTGTLTVTCTRNTPAEITIDFGQNAQGQVRRMTAGVARFLTYDLFKDAARTQRWTENNGIDAGPAPSKEPRLFTIYGRVTQAQDVAEGSFSDTVLATVQFQP